MKRWPDKITVESRREIKERENIRSQTREKEINGAETQQEKTKET